MEKIMKYSEIENLYSSNDIILFYGSDTFCEVCAKTKPQVKELATKLQIPVYDIDLAKNAMARGQLNIFIAPAVLLYVKGKQVYRQAKILDLNKLENIVEDYKEQISNI